MPDAPDQTTLYAITTRPKDPRSVGRDYLTEFRWSPAVKRRLEGAGKAVVLSVQRVTYGEEGPKRERLFPTT